MIVDFSQAKAVREATAIQAAIEGAIGEFGNPDIAAVLLALTGTMLVALEMVDDLEEQQARREMLAAMIALD